MSGRLLYFLGQALRGMVKSPLIQLASIGAMAGALLLVGIALLGNNNVSELTRHWGRGVQLTVYLEQDTTANRVDAIYRLLQDRREVRAVRKVSSREAHRRLQESLGPKKGLLEGVEVGFLPPSLEVTLVDGLEREAVAPLLALLNSAQGVEEVDYLGRWAERLGSVVALVREGAVLIALIIALACLYIVASTIRLGVYARRDEIEIQKLVGATNGFVRAPFLVEGALQGALGAGIGIALLYGLFRWSAPTIHEALGVVLSQIELAFLSPLQVALGLLVGALLGVIGSGLAMGRYVEV